MKNCVITTVTVTLLSISAAFCQEAPGVEAFRKVKEARSNLAKAEAELQSAIAMITPAEQQAQAKKTFGQLSATWAKIIELDASFQEAASPLPSGATSTGLVAYNVETHFCDLQAKRYREWATWIRANYQ